MNNITWKYVKPLVEADSVEKFEAAHGVSIPPDLKRVIKDSNGGRPSLKYYDLPGEKDKEFKTLLSFNESDAETIYKSYQRIDSSDKSMLPFASDSAGNLFVIKDGKVCLWQHESDTPVVVADTFTAFLDMLHA